MGIFVVTWLGALAIWHFGRIEEKWERQASQAQLARSLLTEIRGAGEHDPPASLQPDTTLVSSFEP